MSEAKKVNGYTTFQDGIRSCLPTVLGYLGIGFSFGIVGINSHLNLFEITLMSAVVYGGSSQFVLCGLLLANTSITGIVMTVFLVNLRHLLMSMTASPYFREETLLSNISIGSLLTDESFAVFSTAVAQDKHFSLRWMEGLNITAYITWILATLLGGLVGNFISDPDKFGLDFALTAMFAGLFLTQFKWELSKNTKKAISVVVTVGVSLVILLYFVSSSVAVIISALLGCLVGGILDDK
ncbi:AzlC family ABC transporter permease [Companilactobacillus allii]|uniref:Branched-chain amino acid transporter AzlC n=1 Tax=Companilactobacillus allii TaxID=1847728 RepID=A0A1P8Q697_9LACO|nr:AzlC family ABC transporter permease [Companilactobacillus allii]APX73363.1 branched-chain amino acid transporter AzlC [Companilactobacillus allii]USQ69506.1 AzlC family ABC transporter permease [Companilactobacillus allii]